MSEINTLFSSIWGGGKAEKKKHHEEEEEENPLQKALSSAKTPFLWASLLGTGYVFLRMDVDRFEKLAEQNIKKVEKWENRFNNSSLTKNIAEWMKNRGFYFDEKFSNHARMTFREDTFLKRLTFALKEGFFKWGLLVGVLVGGYTLFNQLFGEKEKGGHSE